VLSNVQTRPFACPARLTKIGFTVGALGAVAATPPEVIGVLEGHRSNCDVYLSGPAGLFLTPPSSILTVWAKEGSIRVPLLVVDLSLVPTDTGGGQTRALAATVRGHPCDGFEVTLAAAATAVNCQLIIEGWGDQSLPDHGGEQLADAMTNGRFPQRAAHLLLWDNAAGVWERARSDGAGAMNVNVTGGAVGTSTSATATQTSVNDSAASQTLLAANAARRGFSIYNDSDQILYLRFNASAATTANFTVKLFPEGFYESDMSTLYTGEIRGIWAADSTGAARVTEYTA